MSRVKVGRMADHLPVVDGMPDLDQGAGWSYWSWCWTSSRRVRVRELTATQTYLDPARVARYVTEKRRRSDGLLVCVVGHGGRLYIADGHHRVLAAIARGESHIEAHVKTITTNRKEHHR